VPETVPEDRIPYSTLLSKYSEGGSLGGDNEETVPLITTDRQDRCVPSPVEIWRISHSSLQRWRKRRLPRDAGRKQAPMALHPHHVSDHVSIERRCVCVCWDTRACTHSHCVAGFSIVLSTLWPYLQSVSGAACRVVSLMCRVWIG
jgi:hypothetical protein